MLHDIFVSYSEIDKKSADDVVSFLESRNLKCWIASRDVTPGANWANSIVKAIDSSSVLVVIFSSNANTSKHIHREVELAVKRGVPIIPVRIEDVMPASELEYFLSSSHWMDAISTPIDQHLEKLITILQSIITSESKDKISQLHGINDFHNSGAVNQKDVLRRKKPLIILILISVIVAISFFSLKNPDFVSDFPNDGESILKKDIVDYESHLNVGDSTSYFYSSCPIRFRIWKGEAERGEAVAQHFIAWCHNLGIGVEKDNAEALKWWEKAADQRYAPAMVAIGYMHDLGIGGVSKDEEIAVRWYQEAANLGNSMAFNNLGSMYRYGSGKLTINGEEALRLYQQAAEMGSKIAMRNIANMYAEGNVAGIAKNDSLAQQWYSRAAKAGDDVSKGNLLIVRLTSTLNAYAASIQSKEANNDSLIDQAASSIRLLDELNLEGMFTVLSDYRVIQAVETIKSLEKSDTIHKLYNETVNRVIKLYRQANRLTRGNNLQNFSNVASNTVVAWYEDGNYQRVVDLWRDGYSDLDITTINTSGEYDHLINQLRAIIISLLNTGYRQEAIRLLDDALKLSDSILSIRPWDWYLKQRTTGLCWDVAAVLMDLDDKSRAQTLLTKAWKIIFAMFGMDDILTRYPVLPLKGKVPEDATEADEKFFLSFRSDEERKTESGMKRYTIPTDFGGTKYPFFVYVLKGKRGYLELQDQFRWIREYRGGEIPTEVQDSFRRLNQIAVENNVDFSELAFYALSQADDNKTDFDSYTENK